MNIILTNQQKTREEWQIAFFIAAAMYVSGGLFYLVFAQTAVQKWANIPPSVENRMKLDVSETENMLGKKSDEAENRV